MLCFSLSLHHTILSISMSHHYYFLPSVILFSFLSSLSLVSHFHIPFPLFLSPASVLIISPPISFHFSLLLTLPLQISHFLSFILSSPFTLLLPLFPSSLFILLLTYPPLPNPLHRPTSTSSSLSSSIFLPRSLFLSPRPSHSPSSSLYLSLLLSITSLFFPSK